jgi:hypothetical protein
MADVFEHDSPESERQDENIGTGGIMFDEDIYRNSEG